MADRNRASPTAPERGSEPEAGGADAPPEPVETEPTPRLERPEPRARRAKLPRPLDEPPPLRRSLPLPGVDLTVFDRDPSCYAGHAIRYGVALLTDGAFDFWYRGAVRTQAPGQMKLKQPGELHRDLRVHRPVSGQSISFEPALVAEAAAACDLPPPDFAHVVLDAARAPALVHLHRVLARPDAPTMVAETALAAALDALLSLAEPSHARRVERARSTSSSRARSPAKSLAAAPRDLSPVASLAAAPRDVPLALRRAREFLEAHLAEPVSLDALATAAEHNKFHLVRLFTRQLGLSPYAYLTQLRLARARLLLDRGVPAAQVALEVGYCDQSQLHRHFVRHLGLTPGQFARAGRR
jgi:AraC-like DNA-binding protein